jgi:exodeoxyribonuclease V beta subunit
MTHQLDPLTFPLHGTRLIEASAGTGKTYTIAALYLRLVLAHGDENTGHGRMLTPPEILVVTFTNAATQELRDRIRNRLTEAAVFFRNGGAGDDYLRSLRSDMPPDTWLDSARVLDQAAQWMDEAAIYTIHSWSQRMLRQHAFDSGSLFDLKLEPDDQDLLEEAARDYWRCNFYAQSSEHLAQLLDLIKCAVPQDLLDKVRPLFNAPKGLAKDPFAMLEKRRTVIETARQSWASDFDKGVERILRAHADKTLNGNKYRKASLGKWLDQLTCWVRENGPLPDEKTREKLSYSGLKQGLRKNKSLPEHRAYEAFDLLNTQLEDLKVDSALFYHAAQQIQQRFDQEKQRRGQMGYDDLLTRLNNALHKQQGDRLAQVIRQQFPVALIDEFQDTDPIQYAAFSKIYLGRQPSGLFMIGDPKQAIYAFRGADIHTYLNARQVSMGNLYTLGKNYRSTQGMVRSVNQMFETASQHPKGAFLFDDQIPFDPVAVQGRDGQFTVNAKPAKSMHWWHLPQDGPVPKTGEQGYLTLMAEAFASEIARLLTLAQCRPPQAGFLKSDGGMTALCPADIAILVRDGIEAKTIRRSLDRRDLRSVYLSDKNSIFASGEAKEMLLVLRACAEPKQESHLKAALATSILGLPLTRLDLLNRDEVAWEAEIDRFCRYRRIWRQRGVLPMIRALLQEFGVPARLMPNPGGERSLTNLLHLSELLQTEAAGQDGAPALIRWLAEMVRQPGSRSDEQILRLESDEELIRVITIHKSKGLEYPLVFLPFICSFRQVTGRHARVVKYHDEQGRLKLIQNPETADLERADRQRLAEDLRLLYVAVTRAKFACRLGIGVMGRAGNSNLHLSGLGYLLSAGDPIPTGDVSHRLEQLKGDCEDIVIAPLPKPSDKTYEPRQKEMILSQARDVVRQVPSDWWIASYSAILDGAGMTGAVYPEDSHQKTPPDAAGSAVEDQLIEVEKQLHAPVTSTGEPRTIHHFPRGPQPGTFLHGLLEWAADEGFDTASRDPQLICRKLQEFCTPRGWDEWVDMLADWFRRLLRTPLALPENQGVVSLADLGADQYQPELEFLFAAHHVDTRTLDKAVNAAIVPGSARPQLQSINVNGMFKGFIDLAFCHQGRYYVMDYKSNYLGEDKRAYGADALTEAILEHRYDLQYVLYTLAVHRLLKARLPEYDYQRDMGGAIYVFLRGINTADGHGVYVDKPPWSLIKQLDGDFAGRKDDHVA